MNTLNTDNPVLILASSELEVPIFQSISPLSTNDLKMLVATNESIIAEQKNIIMSLWENKSRISIQSMKKMIFNLLLHFLDIMNGQWKIKLTQPIKLSRTAFHILSKRQVKTSVTFP